VLVPVHTERATHRRALRYLLPTRCIISSTVDILRLSNDLIWTQREIVTVLGAEERMLWKKTRAGYRVNNVRWLISLSTIVVGGAADLTESQLLVERPLAECWVIDW
jgi:hypothetical protein